MNEEDGRLRQQLENADMFADSSPVHRYSLPCWR
jgi:hypothetical protein